MLTHRSLTDVQAILTVLAKRTQTKPAARKLKVEDSYPLEGKSTLNEL